MTEEEKKAAEEAAKAEAEAKVEAGGESDEDKAKREAEEKEALKTLAAQERERREKAEKALAEQRFRESEERRRKKEAGEEEDKPITASELRAVLAEERQATQKDFLGTRIAEIAKKLADSPEEAELIVEIHKGRTFPAHLTLDEQMEEAKAIALGKKVMAQNAELKRALRGKETVVVDSGSVYKDVPKPNEPKLAPQDKAELSRLGFEWDGKFFSKKLANGKILSRDWKSKKTFIH